MMKCSIRQYAGLAVLAGLVQALPVSAAITTDWVTVGNAGNTANTTGYGAVSYSYKIGRCEVTNAQYAGFLNAVDPAGANSYGIYNSNMASNARGGITFNSAAVNGAKYSVKSNMGNKPVTTVDSAGASTYYGATDMAGNVWEWNDSASGTARGLRGGAWSYDELYMRSSHRFGGTSTAEVDFIGFRIATVPEPSPLVLTMALGAVLCARRKR